MTYLSTDLNRICKAWCPVINQCPEGHYCKMMDTIRRQIIKVSEFNDYKEN